MGKIIKNGISYGGSSTSAGNVSYDNTSTGLQSATVQNAITELKTLQDGNISFSIVNELPSAASAETNIIYLIDTNNNDMFEMWAIVIKNNTKTWAALGETSIDINDLVGKKEYVNNELKGEIFNIYSGHGKNIASGLCSHAEGYWTTASGADSHAEGCLTTASGASSHAGGIGTIANSEASMAIGKYNTPDTQILPSSEDSSDSSDSSDSDSSDSDLPSIQHLFIIGNGTDDSHRSNIVEVTKDTFNVNGNITVAGQNLIIQCDLMPTADEDILGRIVQYVGDTDNDYIHGYFYECVSDEEEPPTYSWEEKVISPQLDQVGHFEYDQYGNITGEIFNTYTGNLKNTASGSYSHAEGNDTIASGIYSHVEGYGSHATAHSTHAEGNGTQALSNAAHAEGYSTIAFGDTTHAEGLETTASGNYSHAEGENSVASGRTSHAEGGYTEASGLYSHAEGDYTEASGYASHAEGSHAEASGNYSHAESSGIASGLYSHAEGNETIASGVCSHAGGYFTEAKTDYSTVIGKCNIVDGTGENDPKHLFIIGNGTIYTRSNILEVSEMDMNVNGDIQQNGVPLRATTMPTITASMLGKVVQYVGASDSNYKQGWNYVAVSDGEETPTYSWQALMDSTPTSGSNNPVASGGVAIVARNGTGGSSSVILGSSPNSTATSAYSLSFGNACNATGNRSIALGDFAVASGSYSTAIGLRVSSSQTCQFSTGKYNRTRTGDLFNIGNGVDASHRSNIVEVNSTSMNVNGDIQRNGVGIDDYTTTERKIGKWIDGSDLYQRTFEVTGLVNKQWNNSALGTSGINIVEPPSGTVHWLYNDVPNIITSLDYFRSTGEFVATCIDTTADDVNILPSISDSGYTVGKAVITIKYTKPSVQANTLNANIQQTEEPIDEMR